MIKALHKIQHYFTTLGLAGLIVFLVAKVLGATLLFRTRIKGIRHPVFVRVATTDVSVLRQVLIEQQYNYALPTLPQTIIDAGANIGLAAVFFANRYPDAKILALEPEDRNYEMLQKNIAPYPNIRPLRAALWKDNQMLVLVDPGAGSHGFQTEDSRKVRPWHRPLIKAFTLDTLMKEMNVDILDVLKIDVEGSEREIFRHSSAWIGRVRIIMAELHDDLIPGCGDAFTTATKNFEAMRGRGETIIRINKLLSSPRMDPQSSRSPSPFA